MKTLLAGESWLSADGEAYFGSEFCLFCVFYWFSSVVFFHFELVMCFEWFWRVFKCFFLGLPTKFSSFFVVFFKSLALLDWFGTIDSAYVDSFLWRAFKGFGRSWGFLPGAPKTIKNLVFGT